MYEMRYVQKSCLVFQQLNKVFILWNNPNCLVVLYKAISKSAVSPGIQLCMFLQFWLE